MVISGRRVDALWRARPEFITARMNYSVFPAVTATTCPAKAVRAVKTNPAKSSRIALRVLHLSINLENSSKEPE